MVCLFAGGIDGAISVFDVATARLVSTIQGAVIRVFTSACNSLFGGQCIGRLSVRCRLPHKGTLASNANHAP